MANQIPSLRAGAYAGQTTLNKKIHLEIWDWVIPKPSPWPLPKTLRSRRRKNEVFSLPTAFKVAKASHFHTVARLMPSANELRRIAGIKLTVKPNADGAVLRSACQTAWQQLVAYGEKLALANENETLQLLAYIQQLVGYAIDLVWLGAKGLKVPHDVISDAMRAVNACGAFVQEQHRTRREAALAVIVISALRLSHAHAEMELQLAQQAKSKRQQSVSKNAIPAKASKKERDYKTYRAAAKEEVTKWHKASKNRKPSREAIIAYLLADKFARKPSKNDPRESTVSASTLRKAITPTDIEGWWNEVSIKSPKNKK